MSGRGAVASAGCGCHRSLMHPSSQPATWSPSLEHDDHARGPDDPALTIIEYGDFDCPHTRRASAELERLLAANPDVRFVFRHFPLRRLHRNAEMLARIAEAAARHRRFWPLHDRLMRRVRIDIGTLRDDLTAVGLRLEAIASLIGEDEVVDRIERDLTTGAAAGVTSTPSFLFAGALHDGHYDHATLAARLDEARRRLATG